MLRSTITLLGLLLIGSLAFSQPITSFPYVEDFDGFPVGTQGSGAEPNPANAMFAPWMNVIANDGPQDWYSVRGSTPTGGTGPTADHTTGDATGGLYLYVEDSGRNNDTVSLLSPIFVISQVANPRMGVWVHGNANVAIAAFGGDSSLNDLKIEVLSAGTWNLLDSLGALQTGWTEKVYDLTPYKTVGGGIVQFRFRVNNQNFGDFIHDFAIDDFTIYNQPVIDGAIVSATLEMTAPTPYTLAPLFEQPSYSMSGRLQNRGLTTLTDVKLVVDFGAFKDSVGVSSLTSFEDTLLTIANAYNPTAGGFGTYSIKANENDTFPANDVIIKTVLDSVYARDDSTANGGLGFTGASGLFGNMFEITEAASLTSTSFFLNSSTVGDTIRAWLFGFGNDIAGEPDTSLIIDATDPWVITGLGWHTLPFSCQPTLPPGQYFIAVQQINPNNLGFGYDLDNFTVGTVFFGDGVGRWTDYNALPASLHGSNLLRMNFGPVTVPKTAVTASATGLCVGDTVSLNASGTGSYLWAGTGLIDTTGASVQATATTAGLTTYAVLGIDANGCFSVDSVTVGYGNVPTLVTSPDTGICEGTTATLSASGGAAYAWSTGDTTASVSVSPAVTTLYTVTASDAFGCAVSGDISVLVSDAPSVALDSSNLACNGDNSGTATANVSGGTPGTTGYSYLWSNSATTASLAGLAAGTYSVTVTDSVGCSGTASVTIDEPDAIMLTGGSLLATAGNSDGSAFVGATGGTPAFSYLWDDTNAQTTDTATGLPAGTYRVLVTDANGCMDSLDVTVDESGVGIDNLLDEQLISVYPNPNNGSFVVGELAVFGMDKKLEISLFDLAGRKVMTQQVQGVEEVELTLSDAQQSGVYLLQVSSDEARVIKRVVVKR